MCAHVLSPAAVSSVVHSGDIAGEIAAEAETQLGAPVDVSCDEDLPAEVDAEVECTLTFDDGSTAVATVTATAVDGDDVEFEWGVDR